MDRPAMAGDLGPQPHPRSSACRWGHWSPREDSPHSGLAPMGRGHSLRRRKTTVQIPLHNHCTTPGVTGIKQTDRNMGWGGRRGTGTLTHWGADVKRCGRRGTRYGSPTGPSRSTQTPGHHCSPPQFSRGTAQKPTSWWMSKQAVICPHWNIPRPQEG